MRTNVRYTKFLILGGGTAGLTVASRLARKLPPDQITLIEPSEVHYYQPLFTLVGAGVSKLNSAKRRTEEFIPRGANWLKTAATAILPEKNIVETLDGPVGYQYLVVGAGMKMLWDCINGLVEGLNLGTVCSNYSERYVENTWIQIQKFDKGNAIFTFPDTPVKCAGAPQKVLYLAEDYFRKKGIRNLANMVFVTPGDKIFGVKKYADALLRICESRGIKILFKHELKAIDPNNRIATIRNLITTEDFEMPFGLLHVTPPMGAPDLIKASPLAGAQGWVDVDKKTLQHVRYPNVFSLGDVSSLPTSRTAAAIRKQAPVLVDNLLSVVARRPMSKVYDGYTSCPLVTGYGKLILAEFDYDGNPCETFPFDQSKERLSMYLAKKYALPVLYWRGMLRGRA